MVGERYEQEAASSSTAPAARDTRRRVRIRRGGRKVQRARLQALLAELGVRAREPARPPSGAG